MNRLCVFFLAASVSAAEWQWSVAVPPLADRTNEQPRAFLWIPPNCERVRAVVFAHHNMEEEGILEHPTFRKTLAEISFAEVWVAPTFDHYFRFDRDAGQRFDAMMKSLAEQSGYSELTNAPVVPVGHSAAASMPWYFAAWKPHRTLACVSVSGQWPYWPDPNNAPHVAGISIDSVPGIVTLGEYEWADQRMPDGLKIRAEHPQLPLSAVGCPADGHFAALDDKIELLALYLKKAAQYRLPNLPAIDPTKTGWLVDRYGTNRQPLAPAAPVGDCNGDPKQAFWFFDEEMAKAAEAFQQRQRGKPALLGYVQDGLVVTQRNGTHQQVTLKFEGDTFKLTPAFLDTVPAGRPQRWTGKKAGEPIEKPADGPPIEIRRICGPVRKISADTWELAMYRASYLGDRRGNEAWFAAIWPGNGTYKRAVQQAMMPIPRSRNTGQPQQITFDKPSDVRAGTKQIKLVAKSDSGLPVHFYVREGPAEVDGDVLRFTPIPPRAKFPVEVTVVAWQFGNAQFKSAPAVERSFRIVK